MAVSQWGVVSDAFWRKCWLPDTVIVAQSVTPQTPAANVRCSFWADVL